MPWCGRASERTLRWADDEEQSLMLPGVPSAFLGGSVAV